jgi:hypothetical protein
MLYRVGGRATHSRTSVGGIPSEGLVVDARNAAEAAA